MACQPQKGLFVAVNAVLCVNIQLKAWDKHLPHLLGLENTLIVVAVFRARLYLIYPSHPQNDF
jgi:hypothetical protein